MALRPLSVVSWGLLAGPPQIVEGMEISADFREPSLEITLEADSITVEIDDE